MPQIRLDASDAAELAELLQFFSGWLSRDPGRLGASLEDFVGQLIYDIRRRSRHENATGLGVLHQTDERDGDTARRGRGRSAMAAAI